MQIVGLIPSRMAAQRLPGKPLLDIAGKPMIWHVWNSATKATSLTTVAVTTPDREIAEVIEKHGGKAVITGNNHRTGSDRLAEAARLLQLADDDIVVNIQGDEPMMDPASIDAVVAPLMLDSSLQMSSAMTPCPEDSLDAPAAVKVVCALNNNALYYSRSRIPHPRQTGGAITMLHLGLYAYRAGFLQLFSGLAPTPLEQSESLEQLRVLEHGYTIRMVTVSKPSIGVDTIEDIERVRKIMSSQP